MVLMVSEHLAQPTLCACALDRGADCRMGSHHADAAEGRINRGFKGRHGFPDVLRTSAKPKSKSAAFHAAASFPNGPDIALAPQVLLGAETHGRTRN